VDGQEVGDGIPAADVQNSVSICNVDASDGGGDVPWMVGAHYWNSATYHDGSNRYGAKSKPTTAHQPSPRYRKLKINDTVTVKYGDNVLRVGMVCGFQHDTGVHVCWNYVYNEHMPQVSLLTKATFAAHKLNTFWWYGAHTLPSNQQPQEYTTIPTRIHHNDYTRVSVMG